MIDVAEYMSNTIRKMMARAYKNVLSNPREAEFVFRMQKQFRKAEQRRKELKETEGLDVPPFLISSIATTCNLHCAGCYARSNGIANDKEDLRKATLTPQQWHDIFTEAAELGINFSLLAGGEPMMRRDILGRVAEVKEMVFPIFTNGTLIGTSYLEFLKRNLNIIPVISIEGSEEDTDDRRGHGVFLRAKQAMERLKSENLFFGTSITVTTENYRHVTSSGYIKTLNEMGCKIVFLVEYVPTEKGTEHLALTETHVSEMEASVEERRTEFENMIFFSFPGDEKYVGGCLASGRGFFHIGPDGSAEPCPFSPFSDRNVAETGLRQALQSPLFRKIRDANALSWQHTGGCTLWEHRDEVEAFISAPS